MGLDLPMMNCHFYAPVVVKRGLLEHLPMGCCFWTTCPTCPQKIGAEAHTTLAEMTHATGRPSICLLPSGKRVHN